MFRNISKILFYYKILVSGLQSARSTISVLREFHEKTNLNEQPDDIFLWKLPNKEFVINNV